MFKLSSYITFHGNCREAALFYKDIFQPADVTITTFKEAMPKLGIDVPAEAEELVFRSELTIKREGTSFIITFCDSPSLLFMPLDQKSANVDNISLAISCDDKEWLRKVYEKLIDGGKTNIVLRENDEGDMEGSLIDKYGICWILSSGDN